MVTVRRYDRLPGSILSVHRCKEDGSLHMPAYARKEGILEYQNPDGSVRRELVTRRAVDTTADTIGQKTITLHHPDGGVVTPENVQELGVGNVGSKVVVEERPAMGGYVLVQTVLRRADAITAFESGEANEVSLGYDVDLDETPGVHPVFGRYDARQLDTRVNHFAMVPAGRAGPEIRFIRADSADRAGVLITPLPRDNTMNRLLALAALIGLTPRHDAADADLYGQIEGGVTALKLDRDNILVSKRKLDDDLKDLLAMAGVADIAGLKVKLAEMAAAQQGLLGERDAALAKVAEYEKQSREAAEKVEGDRMDALAKHLNVRVDGLTLPQKRVAIARTRLDSVTDKTSTDYINAVLEVIAGDIKRTDAGSSLRVLDGMVRADAGDSNRRADDGEFSDPYTAAQRDAAFGANR